MTFPLPLQRHRLPSLSLTPQPRRLHPLCLALPLDPLEPRGVLTETLAVATLVGSTNLLAEWSFLCSRLPWLRSSSKLFARNPALWISVYAPPMHSLLPSALNGLTTIYGYVLVPPHHLIPTMS